MQSIEITNAKDLPDTIRHAIMASLDDHTGDISQDFGEHNGSFFRPVMESYKGEDNQAPYVQVFKKGEIYWTCIQSHKDSEKLVILKDEEEIIDSQFDKKVGQALFFSYIRGNVSAKKDLATCKDFESQIDAMLAKAQQDRDNFEAKLKNFSDLLSIYQPDDSIKENDYTKKKKVWALNGTFFTNRKQFCVPGYLVNDLDKDEKKPVLLLPIPHNKGEVVDGKKVQALNIKDSTAKSVFPLKPVTRGTKGIVVCEGYATAHSLMQGLEHSLPEYAVFCTFGMGQLPEVCVQLSKKYRIPAVANVDVPGDSPNSREDHKQIADKCKANGVPVMKFFSDEIIFQKCRTKISDINDLHCDPEGGLVKVANLVKPVLSSKIPKGPIFHGLLKGDGVEYMCLGSYLGEALRLRRQDIESSPLTIANKPWLIERGFMYEDKKSGKFVVDRIELVEYIRRQCEQVSRKSLNFAFRYFDHADKTYFNMNDGFWTYDHEKKEYKLEPLRPIGNVWPERYEYQSQPSQEGKITPEVEKLMDSNNLDSIPEITPEELLHLFKLYGDSFRFKNQPDNANIVFGLMILSMIMHSDLRAAPMMCVNGPKGSGKSSATERMFSVLFGDNFVISDTHSFAGLVAAVSKHDEKYHNHKPIFLDEQEDNSTKRNGINEDIRKETFKKIIRPAGSGKKSGLTVRKAKVDGTQRVQNFKSAIVVASIGKQPMEDADRSRTLEFDLVHGDDQDADARDRFFGETDNFFWHMRVFKKGLKVFRKFTADFNTLNSFYQKEKGFNGDHLSNTAAIVHCAARYFLNYSDEQIEKDIMPVIYERKRSNDKMTKQETLDIPEITNEIRTKPHMCLGSNGTFAAAQKMLTFRSQLIGVSRKDRNLLDTYNTNEFSVEEDTFPLKPGQVVGNNSNAMDQYVKAFIEQTGHYWDHKTKTYYVSSRAKGKLLNMIKLSKIDIRDIDSSLVRQFLSDPYNFMLERHEKTFGSKPKKVHLSFNVGSTRFRPAMFAFPGVDLEENIEFDNGEPVDQEINFDSITKGGDQ